MPSNKEKRVISKIGVRIGFFRLLSIYSLSLVIKRQGNTCNIYISINEFNKKLDSNMYLII